jgi:hypothetical protein
VNLFLDVQGKIKIELAKNSNKALHVSNFSSGHPPKQRKFSHQISSGVKVVLYQSEQSKQREKRDKLQFLEQQRH